MDSLREAAPASRSAPRPRGHRRDRSCAFLAPSILASAVLAQLVCVFPLRAQAAGSEPPAQPAEDSIRFEASEGTGLSLDLSPDGRTIIIDLLGQLWALPASGGEARAITNTVRDTAHDADPAFSPDGESIVFRSDRAGQVGIWLMPSSGGTPRRITPEVVGWSEPIAPAWSADGRRIAYVLSDTIRIVDVASGAVRNLEIRGLPAAAVRDPAFTADGSHIVFANASRYARNGGPLWQVSADGGDARRLMPDEVRGRSLSPSPDGARLAWIGRDSAGTAHVFVADTGAAAGRRITSHADLAPYRVRWSADGQQLLYAADGHLWRVNVGGGDASRIPFTARVALPRPRHQPARRSSTPPPGAELEARGFMGLALAPDAGRFAMIALGKLWEIPLAGEPRAVRDMPFTAAGLSWSPDGREVIWSAGAGGAEDLFVTTMHSGATRQLTALPGREDRATWSHDGRQIAFLHWHPVPADSAPWLRSGWELRVRVVPAAADRASVDETIDLGPVPGYGWSFSSLAELGQEKPQWSPRSDAVLRFGASQEDSTAALLPATGGEARTLPRFPAEATFVHWASDGSLTFVKENQLWLTSLDEVTGRIEEPSRVSDDTALYPSHATDGTALYLSSDGLRLRTPAGATRRLGWPLQFRTALAPTPLIIRNARLIDGTGAPPQEPVDILVADGRVARIAGAGSLRPPRGAQVLDVHGRTVIPGLIDLHAHLWDDVVLHSSLAYGVTTGREMGTAIARAAGYRDAVDAGAVQGMRLVLGGFQFNPVVANGGFSGSVIQQTSGRSQADRALSLAEALGADYAKMRFPGRIASGVTFIDAARARGMRVSSHCAISLPLVAAGLSGKEHLGASCEERFDGALYGDVAALLRAADMWAVPTITAYATVPLLIADSTLIGSAEARFPATPFLDWWSLRHAPAAAPLYARFAKDARLAAGQLNRAGVTLGAGADVAAPGWALHLELEELVAAGLWPLEALAAATGTAARILGAEDLGTIRPGSRADLVVLDADPLEDIRNTRMIHRVIQAGRVVESRPAAR